MSAFKFKNSKKIIEDDRTTLDAKHAENVNNLRQKEERISDIDMEIEELRRNIQQLEEDNTFLKYENINEFQERIEQLEQEKRNLQSRKHLHKYFLKSGKIMFDYYETKKQNPVNKKKVSKFFNMTNENISDDDDDDKKQELINSYMEINDENFQNINFTRDIKKYYECPTCKEDLKIIYNEALMFCEKCGFCKEIIIDMVKPSYKDPPKEAAYFNYKRINHFNEWLAQFQAKETTEIPKDVYNKILLEFKKQRIKNIANLSRKQLRAILKKLSLNKYYEHIPHIINRLNGIPAPRMTRTTEEKLRNMFKEIQIPFMKHCPPNRKNFMSYSYVLHKFCELLELDDFLQCFPLLKSSEKLYEMDKIWKKICEELKWEFIKSI
jgi:TolA-binding protein